MRWLRHLFSPSAHTRFPAASLDRIARAIADGERRHAGQVMFAVESDLPLTALWRGVSPRERAEHAFALLRTWDTQANNGVLVYLLLADHAIEIVADRALARTLPAQQWQTLISDMQAAFQGGHYAMGMTAALERVSLLLETNFPRDPLQPVHEGGDNLPDTVVIQRH